MNIWIAFQSSTVMNTVALVVIYIYIYISPRISLESIHRSINWAVLFNQNHSFHGFISSLTFAIVKLIFFPQNGGCEMVSSMWFKFIFFYLLIGLIIFSDVCWLFSFYILWIICYIPFAHFSVSLFEFFLLISGGLSMCPRY